MPHPVIASNPSSRAARFGSWYLRHRYAIHFYSLLLTLGFIPAAAAVPTPVPLIKGLLVCNLVVAALSTMTRTMRRVLFGSAIVVFVVVYPVELILDMNLLTGGLFLWSITAAIAAANAIVFAVRASEVDSEHLYAALSAYLLAGLMFGVIHYVIEMAAPGSYAVYGTVLARPFEISEAVYYSYVTLATLGYGDIVPVTEASRSVAIVEAISGQLYLAVMVARIVSVYIPRRRKRRKSPKADADEVL